MTVEDVVAYLAVADDAEANAVSSVADSTVITVVERLRAKGWLTRERAGKALLRGNGNRRRYTAQLMDRVLGETDDRTAALLRFASRLDEREAGALRVALSRLQDEG